MTFRVSVQQFNQELSVEAGQTILDAALARDLPYPHGCRSGNCGACKSELLTGEVQMLAHSDYALTEREREDGLILACRSVPWSNCTVKYLEFDDLVAHPLRHLTCAVTAVENATHDIKRVQMKILDGGPFDFTAGQYASVEFEGHPARDYSMANRPGDKEIEFHIRLLPGGAVTPYVATKLKRGDKVKVFGPHGTAYLREKHTGPMVALAGGAGVAPIKPMVEAALASDRGQPIHLYFGVRDERDLYLEDHFNALAKKHANFKFVPVLSEPSAKTSRRTGFLSTVIKQDLKNLDGAKAYLAGPPIMVETCLAALLELGMHRTDCHGDAFYTEADKAKVEGTAR